MTAFADNFAKPVFLHACATCSGLPSNISTMACPEVCLSSCFPIFVNWSGRYLTLEGNPVLTSTFFSNWSWLLNKKLSQLLLLADIRWSYCFKLYWLKNKYIFKFFVYINGFLNKKQWFWCISTRKKQYYPRILRSICYSY